MKLVKISVVFVLIAVTLCTCDILQQMVTFTKCEFKMNSLSNPILVGVQVQNKKSLSDFNLFDAANVTKSLLSGKLPLSFDLNIEAKNPNSSVASMQKLEWRAFIDNMQITEGVTVQNISIAPGSSQIIPLKVEVDLKKVFSKEGKDALLNMAFNLTDAGGYPTRVRLDVKPTIYVNSIPISYPGYFTLQKEFKAN